MPYANISQPSVKVLEIKEKDVKLSSIQNLNSIVSTAVEVDKGLVYVDEATLNSSTIANLSEKYTFARSILPFRVQFRNVNFGGYSPSNPAPIGIAIIGLNNYIL